jgi:hypothetical protein
MRRLTLLLAALVPAAAGAQAVVTSPAPDRVAVTIYRDPDRGTQPFNLRWLNGYALVSETRRVLLPVGESELRFEGVTGGIVPQSTIVSGLGEAVLEKNRDARLLSPGSLLNAYLGERLMLRRTSRATGVVREQTAVVRATGDGVVLQTADGIEALRCTGLNETLIAPRVPVGLSAKPNLSVRVRSPEAVERTVTLSYITNNFDWQADYVAELSRTGDRLSLFAWMTLANGDATGLADAETQAVAGKLNRRRVWVDPGQAPPIRITCWPSDTTSDIPEDTRLQRAEEIVVTGTAMRAMAPPPPPPPPPAPAPPAVVAEQEQLGDLKLYRIPIAITVAARSQKQVALMVQPGVKVTSLLRMRAPYGNFAGPVGRVLITRNRTTEGLGLPLPAGKVTIFGEREGHRILLGEGRLGDHAVGEKVEILFVTATGVLARQVVRNRDTKEREFELTLTNDLAKAQQVEIELPLDTKAPTSRLITRDGWKVWQVSVPANGRSELRYRR